MPADTWLVVLARGPASAKTRLSGILEPDERADLATAMLVDVLAAAARAPFGQRLVVSDSEDIRPIVEGAGAALLHLPASGTNDAAMAGLRAAAAAGAMAALVLSSDLPLLGAPDVIALLEAGEGVDVVIAPDRHDRGTNALLIRPPLLIETAFGDDSRRRHEERATAKAARVSTVVRKGLATDLDGPDDLRIVLADPACGPRSRAALGRLSTIGSP